MHRDGTDFGFTGSLLRVFQRKDINLGTLDARTSMFAWDDNILVYSGHKDDAEVLTFFKDTWAKHSDQAIAIYDWSIYCDNAYGVILFEVIRNDIAQTNN